MFLKRGVIASVGLLLALAGVATAKSNDPRRPDVWRITNRPVNANPSIQVDTEAVSVDHDGDFLPGRNLTQELGESTHAWKTGYFGNIDVSSGLMNVHETFVDLSTGSTNGLSFVQGFTISTGTLISGGTTYSDVAIRQSSGAPRNITIWLSSGPGGRPEMGWGTTMSTLTLIGSATFYGLDSKGNYATETISFSTGAVSGGPIGGVPAISTNVGVGLCTTMDCGNNPGLGTGNVCWAYISSFTMNVTSMTDAYGLMTGSPTIVIGWGQKIGLANNIISTTPISGYNNPGDVYKVVEHGGLDVTNTLQNPALNVNPTFDYIVFPRLPNNTDEKHIWYRIRRLNP